VSSRGGIDMSNKNQVEETLLKSAEIASADQAEIKRVIAEGACAACWPAQRALIRDYGGDTYKIPDDLKLGRRPPSCHPQPENCYMRLMEERRIREIEEKWKRG